MYVTIRFVVERTLIRSFRHKGLGQFFGGSTAKGISAPHRPRIERMLDRLDAANAPRDMNLPGWRFHGLHGERRGRWAVAVSGNLRLTFAFDGEDAVDVDLEDYH